MHVISQLTTGGGLALPYLSWIIINIFTIQQIKCDNNGKLKK